MPTQDSRIRIKRSTVAGVTPTIPASSNHLDGSWISTDLYIGEFMTNVIDERAWFRASAGLVEITGSTSAWTDVAYSAGDYSASSGTWTKGGGTVDCFQYKIIGKTVVLNWAINSFSFSATPSNCGLIIPSAIQPSSSIGEMYTVAHYYNGTTNGACMLAVSGGSTTLTLYPFGATFTTGSHRFGFTVTYQID